MNHISVLLISVFFYINAFHKESEIKVLVQLVRVTKLDPTLNNVLRATYPIIIVEKARPVYKQKLS